MLLFNSREIGIDMGHRVPNHNGKCKSQHGHRYRIIAHITGPLQEKGSSQGMVLDFGFLKEIMGVIVDVFDHANCLWYKDPKVKVVIPDFEERMFSESEDKAFIKDDTLEGKVVVIGAVPTAENLAIIWGDLIREQILKEGCELVKMEVWETPFSKVEVIF